MAQRHVGDQPFVVLLGDDIMRPGSPLLSDMITNYEETGASTVALMEVDPEDISAYGCAAPDQQDGNRCHIVDVVEKPKMEDAPSNLAIVGTIPLHPGHLRVADPCRPRCGR